MQEFIDITQIASFIENRYCPFSGILNFRRKFIDIFTFNSKFVFESGKIASQISCDAIIFNTRRNWSFRVYLFVSSLESGARPWCSKPPHQASPCCWRANFDNVLALSRTGSEFDCEGDIASARATRFRASRSDVTNLSMWEVSSAFGFRDVSHAVNSTHRVSPVPKDDGNDECKTSKNKSHESRAGIPSMNKPASKEKTTESEELCETAVCFLHIQLIGTKVRPSPKTHKHASRCRLGVFKVSGKI